MKVQLFSVHIEEWDDRHESESQDELSSAHQGDATVEFYLSSEEENVRMETELAITVPFNGDYIAAKKAALESLRDMGKQISKHAKGAIEELEEE